jgi:predicted AlkP superfamily pyrophosphatase or phosphodiesterase
MFTTTFLLISLATTLLLATAADEPSTATTPNSTTQATPPFKPNKVLIILFDQMIPQYADAFAMTNFQRLRDSGVWFKQAMLGYMCSETVVSHNVVVSGKLPRNMGWTDAVLRDANNLLGFGVDSLHLTGDLSLANFSALIKYPKLADYVHTQFPGSSFIVVGEKSYAVESAAAPSADIAVRMSSRTNAGEPCEAALGGRYRFPAGKNVPAYISEPACGRFFVNCESDLGTAASFPSWLYPSDGGHFSPGSDPAHLGGDTWVADAALAMMDKEPWRGMYVTMGAIDKAAHQFGASFDIATPVDCKNNASDQVHVRCAAELADKQLGRLLDKVAAQDERDGTETLVVLTADHGGMVASNFYGSPANNSGFTNWIYAPKGIFIAGQFVKDTLNKPSPALAPLVGLNNVAASYQSTAIQVFLIDRSTAKVDEAARAVLTMQGVIAVYTLGPANAAYRLHTALNATMTLTEMAWWKARAQSIIDGMASLGAPDVVGLLHDETSYGVFGDHGGHQEAAQRVPVVFWSKNIAASRAHRRVSLRRHFADDFGGAQNQPDGAQRRQGRIAVASQSPDRRRPACQSRTSRRTSASCC